MYSLPSNCTLKHPHPDCLDTSEMGEECVWKVRTLGRFITLDCVRQQGCNEGSCPPSKLSDAFSSCTDVCSDGRTPTFQPSKCTECLKQGRSWAPTFWAQGASGWSCLQQDQPPASSYIGHASAECTCNAMPLSPRNAVVGDATPDVNVSRGPA
uniref:Uncharacterized protein n=1 Tax=Haptolina ericina TaxID=156174 RepID=A0A7S3ARJ0_9EUKA